MNHFLEQAQKIKDQLIEIRRTLHQMPELGDALPQTSAFVMRQLESMGIEPIQMSGGLTGCIGGKHGGKVFLLRGDMDGLPMQEESGLPFASQNGFAHTCGHDFHTTMLLGAARLLKENEEQLQGTVKLMFQPAEETLTGAAAMIADGILENPKVDAGMTMHVFPGEMHAGTLAWLPGPLLASSDCFHITVTGKAGHGAMPQNAVDPIQVAAHILLALQEINAREVNPQDPLVLTVCTFHAGELHNAIPENAKLTGSIRAYSKENRQLAKTRLTEICDGMSALFRATCTVEFPVGTPATLNDPALTRELASYADEVAEKLIPLERQMGSEDFAYVTQEIPAAFFGIGAGGTDAIYHQAGSHHPRIVFNEAALPFGAAIFAHSATEWLSHHKND